MTTVIQFLLQGKRNKMKRAQLFYWPDRSQTCYEKTLLIELLRQLTDMGTELWNVFTWRHGDDVDIYLKIAKFLSGKSGDSRF